MKINLYKQIEIEPDSKLAWIRLSLVFVVCAIGFIGMWSVVMIMPAIEQEFDINRSSSTIPYISTMMGFGVGNIIIGKYTDKFGITKPVVFAFICLIICYFFSVSSTNLIILSLFEYGSSNYITLIPFIKPFLSPFLKGLDNPVTPPS